MRPWEQNWSHPLLAMWCHWWKNDAIDSHTTCYLWELRELVLGSWGIEEQALMITNYSNQESTEYTLPGQKSRAVLVDWGHKRQNWPCSLLPATIGWNCWDSAWGFTMVVTMRKCWKTTQLLYNPRTVQGYKSIHHNFNHIHELIENVKGLGLHIQNYRISMKQDENRISRRCCGIYDCTVILTLC